VAGCHTPCLGPELIQLRVVDTLDVARSSAMVSVFDNDWDGRTIQPPSIQSIGSDTGLSGTDRLTNDTTLSIFGTSAPGSTVTVVDTPSTTGSPTTLGSAVTDSGGLWTLAYATALAEATHRLTARAALGGATSGDSATLPVIVDTTTPSLALRGPDSPHDRVPALRLSASDRNGLGTTATLDIDLNNDGDYSDTGETGVATATVVGGTAVFRNYAMLPVGSPWQARARLDDAAGNAGVSPTIAFTVTSTSPSLISTAATDQFQSSVLSSGALVVSEMLDIDLSPASCGCQNAALLYDSSTASPLPSIQVVYQTTNATTAVPANFLVTFVWDGVTVVAGESRSTLDLAAGGQWTTAFQPSSSPITGRHTYAVSVFADYADNAYDTTLTVTGSTFVVNNTASDFGAGWSFSNTDRLVDIPAAGTDPAGKLLISGRGGWKFYAATGSGGFSRPAGDTGTLAAISGGWSRTSRDNRTLTFDSAGRMTNWASADGGEVFTYTYDGGGRLQTAQGWDGGVATFAYDGTSKIQSITAAAGGRVSAATVDGVGDLTRIVRPAGGLRTLTYSGHKLTRIGSVRPSKTTLTKTGWCNRARSAPTPRTRSRRR